jgi:hypothetical protein
MQVRSLRRNSRKNDVRNKNDFRKAKKTATYCFHGVDELAGGGELLRGRFNILHVGGAGGLSVALKDPGDLYLEREGLDGQNSGCAEVMHIQVEHICKRQDAETRSNTRNNIFNRKYGKVTDWNPLLIALTTLNQQNQQQRQQ